MKQVGFIGLGKMGSAMAANLLESGYSLSCYNRTAEKAKPLLDKGATLVKSPSELFEKEDSIVISMLANDKAVEEIFFNLTPKKGCILLSMCTISPKLGQKLNEYCQTHQAHFVAAPVFGLPFAAAARKLNICVAGDAGAKKRVEPILKELGQKTFDFGDNPINSMVVKLIGNFLICNVFESLAEGLNLGKKYGIDPALIYSMLTQTIFPGRIYEQYGKKIVEQNFEPAHFELTLGLKDMKLVADAANHVQAIMPIGELLLKSLENAYKMGRGHLDWSGVTLFIPEGNKDAYK